MAQYKGAASEAGRSEALLKQRELEKLQFELKKKEIQDVLKYIFIIFILIFYFFIICNLFIF
jgi:hypothetical protein